jgi:hypothetical protein
MTGHRLEVADVFHAHQNQFLQRWGHVVSDQQRKVLRDIGRCRTAALGTHLERCDRCSYETVAYDSCRNRHCPKCQSSARDRWLLKQASSLLPVPYAHVVFTVPEQLAPLALRNQRLFYNLLFRAASETLLEIAADPRHLGARIGALAVLHTWSQNLGHHPHLHCLVPAGGLALDRSRWVRSRRDFFLPVRVLSRMFRGKLLAFLKQSYRHNELGFSGTLAALSQPRISLPAPHAAPARVGGLLQASLRRPRTRPEVPGPLYPPCRHLQRKAAQPRQRTGALPLARLQTQQPQRRHDPRRSRVHPPLPAPRPARRLRQDPPLRTARQPQPPARPSPSAGSISTPPPRTSAPADRTAEVRAQPILSPVQKWHPARGRKTATGWNGQLPRTARLRALRLILRKTMSTRMPTRHRASTDFHSAHATPCLESAPHSLEVGCSLLHALRKSTVGPVHSDHRHPISRPVSRVSSPQQQSIPILLPR